MAKFCTNCGATLSDDKQFCTECGTPMNKPPETEPVSTPQPTPILQPEHGSPYEPITVGGYIGIMLLMCIPLIGIILTIVWACGGCKKINKRNLARASLIMIAIGLVISLLMGVVVKSMVKKVTNTIEEEIGFSLSGNEDDQDSLGGLGALGALAGLAGEGDEHITNRDIEELEELNNTLEGLEGLTGDDYSGLSGLVEGAEAANRDAEAVNDGWPKSLRKYPNGTATAVASYRTEISETTEEEMLAWIEDLRSDGFEYQDFYDFGMTEEDMLSVSGWWATDGDIYLSVSYYDGVVTIDHTKELPDLDSYFN